MKSNIVLVLVLIQFLSACGSFANKTSDLRSNPEYVKSKKYCYDISFNEVHQRIKSHVQTCWNPPRMNFALREQQEGSTLKMSIKSELGYTFGMDLTPGTGTCRTELKMFAMNSFWQSDFENINYAIENDEVECRN